MESQTPQITFPVANVQPKPNNFLIVLLSVLLLLSVSIAGFFAYQTQMLVKELTLLKIEPTPTAVAPTVEPVATDSVTVVDPAANWKTYTNAKYGYSFNLPKDWVNYSMNDFSVLNFNYYEDKLYLGAQTSKNRPPQIMQLTTYRIDEYNEAEMFPNCTVKNIKVGPSKLDATHKSCVGLDTNGYITIKNDKNVFIIDELKGSIEDHQTFDQILSTFKFTN
jgi:hypothetical protein